MREALKINYIARARFKNPLTHFFLISIIFALPLLANAVLGPKLTKSASPMQVLTEKLIGVME